MELVGGAILLGGGGVGVAWGLQQLPADRREPVPVRAPEPVLPAPPPAPVAIVPDAAPVAPPVGAPLRVEIPTDPGAELSTAALAELSRLPVDAFTFEGKPDETLLAPLRDPVPVRARFNQGGSSISIRLDLASGGRAAFKPDQTNLQSVPRRDVAAYRVARLLGLPNVAPSIPGELQRTALMDVFEPASREWLPRFQAEVPGTRDGRVTGSFTYWIPTITFASLEGDKIDSTAGIIRWKRYLTVGERFPEGLARTLAQISDMVLFDFLINNFDRFSGGNTRASGDGALLYFMDNALSFRLERRGQLRVRTYFERSQRFSRRTVGALRALDPAIVRAVMQHGAGPWGKLLTEAEIDAMFARRDYALAYIDGLIAAHGEAEVLVFP
jgi:hypothetical protein